MEIYILEPLSTMHKYTLGTYNFDESMRGKKRWKTKRKEGEIHSEIGGIKNFTFPVVALGLIIFFSLDFVTRRVREPRSIGQTRVK